MNIHNVVSENMFRNCLPIMKLSLLFLTFLLVVALLQVEDSDAWRVRIRVRRIIRRIGRAVRRVVRGKALML